MVCGRKSIQLELCLIRDDGVFQEESWLAATPMAMPSLNLILAYYSELVLDIPSREFAKGDQSTERGTFYGKMQPRARSVFITHSRFRHPSAIAWRVAPSCADFASAS